MLIIRKEAEEDIKIAFEWYEEQTTRLGIAFVEEVASKLEEIEEHPALYMEIMSNVRRAFCKKFPYTIYFIHKNSDIIVIAVLHQRRSPALWQARNKVEKNT